MCNKIVLLQLQYSRRLNFAKFPIYECESKYSATILIFFLIAVNQRGIDWAGQLNLTLPHLARFDLFKLIDRTLFGGFTASSIKTWYWYTM